MLLQVQKIQRSHTPTHDNTMAKNTGKPEVAKQKSSIPVAGKEVKSMSIDTNSCNMKSAKSDKSNSTVESNKSKIQKPKQDNVIANTSSENKPRKTKSEQERFEPSSETSNNSSPSDDPSPLIPPRRTEGDSPPKVIKRKAPPPVQSENMKSQKPSVTEKSNEQILMPVLLPPPKSSFNVGEQKSVPESRQQVPSGNKEEEKSRETHPTSMTSPIPTFELTLTNTDNSTNASVCVDMAACSSTEHLITIGSSPRRSSPTPLQPVKKIDDVNTIKRQPKSGWL